MSTLLFRGYTLLRYDRRTNGTSGGGVAIVLREILKFKELEVSSPTRSIEVCGCELESELGTVTVIDFNAHSSSWGDSRDDERGQEEHPQ
ncbi:hypothetical protein FF38_02169 [Lucilia cuprina]|uniref:Uncharacterized protein n=1 Tax=Lucilia cuprina TaxID=7375 RepID=A0A0L0CE26_LUCCU|nr:hypothetical protein FF38_02169 [Lucilia cuprina]